LSEESASGLHGSDELLRHVPARIDRIPLELSLNVRDEIAGLADTHDAADFVRARTRSRTLSKSVPVNGEVGASAASSNQASNSGVRSKGRCRCSRTERMTSFTNSLASAQTPERT